MFVKSTIYIVQVNQFYKTISENVGVLINLFYLFVVS